MLADPAVMRFIGAELLDREQAWRKLLQSPGLWALLGYGNWTVERREDGAFLGLVGFADYKRELIPSLEGLPEMGWLLAGHAHGQGYAAEAVSAALEWAGEAIGSTEIVAIIHPDNAPSIRLAERCGFRRAEDTLYRGDPTLIFRRP
jgi:RimJ/RimL family protein N-acetyltransferase